MFGSFHLRFLAHDFLFNQFAGGFLKHKMVGIQRAGYQSFAEAVHGVDNASGGILSHGIAWLGGDFREGPSVDLSERRAVVIESKGSIGLLLDGEPAELPSGATYRLDASPLAFLATAPVTP